MLQIYLTPIISAIYIFPFLAALFTIPYIIIQYRKYGSMLVLRIAVVYSFIFYMMTSYFMTVLPLPPRDSVTATTSTVLLVPFDAVRNWIASSGINITNPSTILPSLTDMNFLQILFNIILLLPFGVYLRYYFNRKWYQVLIMSFLYSLFFELTQLSGLYGYYPYPYRFFEVDDLICNTLGGMIGFLITPALLFFLPSRERLDEIAYEKGTHVSIFRRFIALVADLLIVAVIMLPTILLTDLHNRIPSLYFVIIAPSVIFLYFTLCELLLGGRTPGKCLVKISLASSEKDSEITKPNFFQILGRNFILYMILFPSVIYIVTMITLSYSTSILWLHILLIILSTILLFAVLFFIVNILRCFINKNVPLCYDKICHLKTISTVHSESHE